MNINKNLEPTLYHLAVAGYIGRFLKGLLEDKKQPEIQKLKLYNVSLYDDHMMLTFMNDRFSPSFKLRMRVCKQDPESEIHQELLKIVNRYIAFLKAKKT